LSDVVRAMMEASDDPYWDGSMDSHPVRVGSHARLFGVSIALLEYGITFPKLLGVDSQTWLALTDEEREAAVVAEARRLKVPRRA
jgi:hypothetical protein